MLIILHVYIQLTNDTYGDAVSMLSQIVRNTENNTGQQTSEVLSQVASYLEDLASFVNESNVIINMTVSIHTNRIVIVSNDNKSLLRLLKTLSV